MLDALRDTHAASNGSTPVANHRQELLEEIIKSTSPYHTLGFNVAVPLASRDGEVRVFYI